MLICMPTWTITPLPEAAPPARGTTDGTGGPRHARRRRSRTRSSLVFALGLLAIAALLPAAPAVAEDRTFPPIEGDVLNPERGLYESIDLVNETELGWVRDQGFTLAFAYIRLDDYRDATIPQNFLEDVTRGLDAARAAGIKIIFRVSYNFGIGEDDASMERVLEHIGQFESIWVQHQDVIAVVQAGFIGAWGEWHSSTNGLDTPEAKAEIRTALLAAVPDSRMVQFRYLPDLETWSPTPVASTGAYDGSAAARTAHHNDCFLATDSDAGTYWPGDINDHKAYLGAASEFVAVGGETCQVGFDENQERRSCAVATAELARFHWSYLNEGFHAPTLQIWKDQGCWAEITQSLGYRYRLVASSLPDHLLAGGPISGNISIANDGYSTLFNERPVYLVLDGPTRVEIELDTDPRRWTAGETTNVGLATSLPATVPAGEYTMSLWLPDAAGSLRADSDFAIRLANAATWDQATGSNIIGAVTVVPATTCVNGVGSRFTDVTADHAFCADVEWLAEAAITKGCNPPANDRFCPDSAVTRGQMAAFLVRSLNLPGGTPDTFSDDDGSIFETHIEALAAAEVTKGCNPPSNDRFCPTQTVTRGQMAAFLHRALRETVATTTPPSFTDIVHSTFSADITWLGATGITKGCNPPTNDRFCPDSPVTRAQMAAFLHRALSS